MNVHTPQQPDLNFYKRSGLKSIQIRMIARFSLGLYSTSIQYGLRRDLLAPLERPKAKIPISVRALTEGDLEQLLPLDEQLHEADESLDIARRRAFVIKNSKSCFVAVDQRENKPCYMQWLFGYSDNTFIRQLGCFPELTQDEALVENVYTPAKYRRLGIMSAAMAEIAERAADFGARYVMVFVDEDNLASLKGCQRSGFTPHLLHHRKHILFGLLKLDRFERLPISGPRSKARLSLEPQRVEHSTLSRKQRNMNGG